MYSWNSGWKWKLFPFAVLFVYVFLLSINIRLMIGIKVLFDAKGIDGITMISQYITLTNIWELFVGSETDPIWNQVHTILFPSKYNYHCWDYW
ncbi:hypothetical protein [Risungbinella massiliensis]|uniref:hypothetical protein n=1 Tax=Risungbinella massiliensis TaxID=1329796 RepID=UPI0005CBE42B|nr:hypothetical protein [Risungbinella massiliensis]